VNYRRWTLLRLNASPLHVGLQTLPPELPNVSPPKTKRLLTNHQATTTPSSLHALRISTHQGTAAQQAWAEDCGADSPDPNAYTRSIPTSGSFRLWSGLRVRMGLHSGLSDPTQVVINPTTRRTQYSGSFAAAAKHVCDAGHGGQILLSHSAFEQIGTQDMAGCHVLAMGEHVLEDDQLAVPLYQAAMPGLAARLRSFPPLRSKQLIVEGVLAATVGTATVVFVNASGVQTLMAWDVEVARDALQLYHDKVQRTLQKYGGYVAELADGLALVVFPHPAAAIEWALEVQKRLIGARWPRKLLEHELCEPVVTMVALDDEVSERVPQLLFPGTITLNSCLSLHRLYAPRGMNAGNVFKVLLAMYLITGAHTVKSLILRGIIRLNVLALNY
jgi:class 3 adenylate cyclase